MSASTSTAVDKDPSENVRVVVRTRPLNEAEIYMGCVEIVSVNSVTRTINVKKISPKPELPKTFTFDYVFDTDTSQLSVYAETTKPIVDSVIEGYNGTVLAYGQTGAGKTYTMFGKQDSPITAGIVPNVFAQLYGHIARSSEDKKFLVCVSYLEIYNEEVRDLISNDRNLDIRECQGLGVYVQGLTAYLCRTAADIQKILKVGDKNRSTGATAINEESSRSHAILTVTVECSHTDGDSCQRITQGKLSLVDLAGSERQSKTQASGERLKEATKINLSLSVLGNVISALVDGKSSHIPYRNSKLTRLLQDSLGGSSKTVMIANIGPACVNYEETVSTLRYANRAKNIKNKVKMNEEPKDTLIRKFELQIFDLRRQLKEASNRKIIIEVEVEEEDRPEEIDFPEEQKIEENIQEAGSSIGIVKSEESVHKSISASSVKAAKMAELDRTISERDFLVKELERVSSSIIMGGENLLEKAQQQDELLEAASQELEERKRSEEQILENLKSAEAERIDIEERYNTLSEEVSGKTKKLNKLIALVNAAKADLADVQSEQQRELEGSLENMRVITRELQLCDAVINDCIPKEYMNLIESIANYNEETGEWQLKCVAYTGNNMQKTAEPETASSFMTWLNTTPEFPVYVQYGKKLELGEEEDEVLVLYDSRSSTSHPTQSSDSDNSGINFTESELALFTSRILCETNIDCSGQRYIRPTFGLSSQKSNLEIPSTSQDITTTLSKKISFKTNSSIFGS